MEGFTEDFEFDCAEGLVGEAQAGAVNLGEAVFAEAQKAFGVATVDFVAYDGPTQRAERGADLVGASGDEFGFKEGGVRPGAFANGFKPGGGASVFWKSREVRGEAGPNEAAHGVDWGLVATLDGTRCAPTALGEAAVNEDVVDFAFGGFAKDGGHLGVFRHKEDTAGFTV